MRLHCKVGKSRSIKVYHPTAVGSALSELKAHQEMDYHHPTGFVEDRRTFFFIDRNRRWCYLRSSSATPNANDPHTLLWYKKSYLVRRPRRCQDLRGKWPDAVDTGTYTRFPIRRSACLSGRGGMVRNWWIRLVGNLWLKHLPISLILFCPAMGVIPIDRPAVPLDKPTQVSVSHFSFSEKREYEISRCCTSVLFYRY